MIILFNKGKTFIRILTNLIGLCPKLQQKLIFRCVYIIRYPIPLHN